MTDFVQAQPTPPQKSGPNYAMLGVAVAGVGIVSALVAVLVIKSGEKKVEHVEMTGTRAASAQPSPKPQLSPLQEYMRSDLKTALGVKFEDSTAKMDDGTIKFSLWCTQGLAWADIYVAENETFAAKVRKDSDGERRKRGCWKGYVLEIQADAVDNAELKAKAFRGLMLARAPDLEPLVFYAVADTGDIVEKSEATLCGFVTGLHHYTSADKSNVTAMKVVGMFDLPTNRARVRVTPTP